jgi:tRNA1(Val) A37 N6-methylase TrmN6
VTDLTDDAFLCGRVRLWQPARGYRAATDPVLLAACVPAVSGDRVLDLGCGAGAVALCLASRVPGLSLAGVEAQPLYADLARRNAARNGHAMDVHDGRIENMPAALRRDFDHVIANPPFYAPGGTPSPDTGRATALMADTPVAAWVTAGLRRLRPGGWLTMILSTPLLPLALAVQPNATVLPLAARDGRAPARVIAQWRKSSRAPFRLLFPFVIHKGPAHDGDREDYTLAAEAVLRQGTDLLAHFRAN